SMEFANGGDDDAQLVAAINDGGGFSGRHTFANAKTVARSPSSASAAFRGRALSDLVRLNALLSTRVGRPAACGQALTSTLSTSQICIALGLASPFCRAAPEAGSLTAANCSGVSNIGVTPSIFANLSSIRTSSNGLFFDPLSGLRVAPNTGLFISTDGTRWL